MENSCIFILTMTTWMIAFRYLTKSSSWWERRIRKQSRESEYLQILSGKTAGWRSFEGIVLRNLWGLRSDIYWKSIVYVTCIIDFQYWERISDRSRDIHELDTDKHVILYFLRSKPVHHRRHVSRMCREHTNAIGEINKLFY